MSTTLTYRPEVDGLRTIAVLSVVIYHADFMYSGQNVLPGGFLGVDIFFVISGYLISAIILKGLASDSFSFADFYERRVRRILPVLFTVILATIPFAWYYLLPEAMREYAYSVITAILFTSNIWFWSQDPYWATESSLDPLLHTWSLAVEEQFYLVMPVILIFLYRVAKGWLFYSVLFIGLVSLAFAQWASAAHPEFAFFMLPARMWELIAGTLLAIIELRRGRNPSRTLVEPLSILGLAMVVASFFYFSGRTQHPSALTLVPIAGTMLLIWYAHPRGLVTRLLSSDRFVEIGLISYGLYLWHFPVFAFGKMAIGKVSLAEKILLILLAIVLAKITYALIETPFRRRNLIPLKYAAPSLGVAAVALMAFGSVAAQTGLIDRFSGVRMSYFSEYLARERNVVLDQLEQRDRFAYPDKTNVAIIGDSHAGNMFLILDQEPEYRETHEFVRVRGLFSSINPTIGQECRRKKKIRNMIFNQINVLRRADVLLIAERFSPESWNVQKICLQRHLKQFKKLPGKVVLLTPQLVMERYQLANRDINREENPILKNYLKRFPTVDPSIYLLRNPEGRSLADIEREQFDQMMLGYNQLIRDMEQFAKAEQITVLNPLVYQCDYPAGRCYVQDDAGQRLYVDTNHVSNSGSRFLAGKIVEAGWLEAMTRPPSTFADCPFCPDGFDLPAIEPVTTDPVALSQDAAGQATFANCGACDPAADDNADVPDRVGSSMPTSTPAQSTFADCPSCLVPSGERSGLDQAYGPVPEQTTYAD